MLFQVGGQGTRPTFFEMAAAQQLPSSLRAALTYSPGVFALRRPFIHKILDYEDEFFALLMMVLETHSLRTTDASFSESLYGLRRRGVEIGLKKSNVLAYSGTEIRETGLRKHQKLLSVVFLVVLPYMKSKLQSFYDKDRQATLHASLWGDSDERFGDTDYLGRGDNLFGSRFNLDTKTSAGVRWTKFLRKTVDACYPWLHAGTEDPCGYRLLISYYIFWMPPVSTLQDYMHLAFMFVEPQGRSWQYKVDCSAAYMLSWNAQTGLIASVFFFKMMEWRYQSAEDRMSAPAVYPPPPPPIGPMDTEDKNSYDIDKYVRSNHEPWIPRPLLSMHVRMGDKACEMEVVGLEEWMHLAQRVRKRFPHLNNIWLSTEMQVRVICTIYGFLIPVVEPGELMSSMDQNPTSIGSFTTQT